MNNYLPSYIEYKSYKYIESDGKYYIIIQCFKLPKNIEFLEVIEKLKQISLSNVSIFLKKLNSMQQSKMLTNKIVNCLSEINTISKNRIDIEYLKQNKDDLEEIRRKIQIDGESLYEVLINIMISDYNLEKLYKKVDYIESYLSSNNIIFKRLNYRQDLGFKSCLPLISNSFSSNINLMSKGLTYMFPFYTKTINDLAGIYIGNDYINNKLIFIDIFSKKYKNSNICILGSSGTGKSYFIKIFILRQFLIQKKQIIFDLEGEYTKIFKILDPVIIDFTEKKKINLLDIFYMSNNEDFLENKIKEVYNIFNSKRFNYNNFSQKIKKVYKDKGITSEKSSLFNEKGKYLKKVLKDFNDMPILDDLNLNIKDIKYNILNGITDSSYQELYNKSNIVIFDFSKVNKVVLEDYFDIAFNIINNILDFIDNDKILYFDEIWKLISVNKAKYSIKIAELYKTIRKKRASIISITQDIEDFFTYEDEKYGKKILNNSNFKFFFSLNYFDSNLINKNIMNRNINMYVKKQSIGNCIAMVNDIPIQLDIIPCEYEKNIIEESD